VIRPRVREIEESRCDLLYYMRRFDYPHADAHEEIIDYSFVVTCEADDEIAGFFWCYAVADDETTWSAHALVVPEYQGRFFSKRLMNTLFSVAWTSGADRILVENTQTDMLLRMGGYRLDDGAVLDLPHQWR